MYTIYKIYVFTAYSYQMYWIMYISTYSDSSWGFIFSTNDTFERFHFAPLPPKKTLNVLHVGLGEKNEYE